MQLSLIDGLCWYLEARNWALKKIKACPIGSEFLDVRIYHYMYFSNLLSAVDLVADHLREKNYYDFLQKVQVSLGSANYGYVRELRNAIVHRGFDPAVSGHADDSIIYVMCPARVTSRKGNRVYTCTFKYMVELAEHCNRITNAVIFETLNEHELISSRNFTVNKNEFIGYIENSEEIPGWLKEIANKSVNGINFSELSVQLAEARSKKVKSLLGRE